MCYYVENTDIEVISSIQVVVPELIYSAFNGIAGFCHPPDGFLIEY